MVDSDEEYTLEMNKFMHEELAAIKAELKRNGAEKPKELVQSTQTTRITKIEPVIEPKKAIIRSEPLVAAARRSIPNIPPEIARSPPPPPPPQQVPVEIQRRPPPIVSEPEIVRNPPPPQIPQEVQRRPPPIVSEPEIVRNPPPPPLVQNSQEIQRRPPSIVSEPEIVRNPPPLVLIPQEVQRRPPPIVSEPKIVRNPPPLVRIPQEVQRRPPPIVTEPEIVGNPPPPQIPQEVQRRPPPIVSEPEIVRNPPPPPLVQNSQEVQRRPPPIVSEPEIARNPRPPPLVQNQRRPPPSSSAEIFVPTPPPTVTQQMPLMKPAKPEVFELRRELNFEYVSNIPNSSQWNPPVTVIPQAPLTTQTRPSRANSDRIQLQHRPATSSRRTEEIQQTVNNNNQQPQPLPPPPPAAAVAEVVVDVPFIESDTSIYRGNLGRNRPVVPLFEPAVAVPVPEVAPPQVFEQSTWVDEDSEYHPNPHVMNPNAAIFTSSVIRNPGNSTLAVEEQMFPELVRARSRHEIQDGNSRIQMNSGAENAEILERPTTAMSRRPPILPPPSKGRTASVLNQTLASNVANMNLNYDDFDFDETPQQLPSPNQISRRSQPVNPPNGPSNSQNNPNKINLEDLTTEALEKMNEEQLKDIVNILYESSPHLKLKESYPFMAEGLIQKDSQTTMLKVFSARLGKVLIQDTRVNKSNDYVYFLVLKPGEYRGFYYDTHPKCLTSAKFPTVDRIVLRGHAILAHPIGSREDSLKESRWICWNDSLGLMSIISGAARLPLKKTPVWDKQLDIISIHANYENRRFVVTKVVGLTNTIEQKDQFPAEVFLVRDGVYRKTVEDDIVFYSKSIKAEIVIKKTLVGEVNIYENNIPLDIVVVPTFPRSTQLEFRALLIIHMPDMFWSRDKEWIRELLMKRTQDYIR